MWQGVGKNTTFELAESFARDKSGGKKVTYTNPVAVEKNGGWRYSYGNMFYVLLVSQYLTWHSLMMKRCRLSWRKP